MGTDLQRRSAGELAGFGGVAAEAKGGELSIIQREESEMKAAIALARSFPRSEEQAYTQLMNSCKRPGFAEDAIYSFPRGGQTIMGPSVDLAREIARLWGNIRYGLRIVSDDGKRIHVKGYAYDLQTNTLVEAEDSFARLIYRKNQGWIEPDERDLRELINRRGAICVRNAILQVMPPDVVEDAMRQVQATMEKAANGEMEQDRTATVRRLCVAYSQVGVTVDMLAQHLGHPVDLITADELAKLRAIYKSIVDGNSRREEHFTMPAASQPAAAPEQTKAAKVADKLKKPAPAPAPKQEAPKPEPKPEPEPVQEPAAEPPPATIADVVAADIEQHAKAAQQAQDAAAETSDEGPEPEAPEEPPIWTTTLAALKEQIRTNSAQPGLYSFDGEVVSASKTELKNGGVRSNILLGHGPIVQLTYAFGSPPAWCTKGARIHVSKAIVKEVKGKITIVLQEYEPEGQEPGSDG